MIHTSDYCVIKEDEDDEGGVEEGEGDEQLVEGVVHLLGGEHRHGEQIATQAHHTNQRHQDALYVKMIQCSDLLSAKCQIVS